MGGPEPISAEGRRALEQQLADLHAERQDVAATLVGDDSPGDHADQADELQRADELRRLDARIEDITLRLHQAVAAGPAPAGVVGVGSTVTVRFTDGAVQSVAIGEIASAADENLVTEDSPLGRALLGHRVGDTVSFETPQGSAHATVVSLGDS
ncbi:GreA/GreB family elongation factor [Streptomyces sp. NPDC048279]|jgi:transcription elongation factor GreA|uniref:GreA/GreB family elongation factor n=1 Tax=unclassified Streptomyces TaxID=2593676 RepID=UPI003430D4A4